LDLHQLDLGPHTTSYPSYMPRPAALPMR
jgi:hypothetical protein